MLTFHAYHVLYLPEENTVFRTKNDLEFIRLKECIRLRQEQSIEVIYLPNN